MPYRCVVYGCLPDPIGKKNSTLFKFPDDPKLQRKWNNFVSKTRKWPGCTESSRVCSKHFKETDFSNFQKFSLDFSKLLILNKNSFPTIYPEATPSTPSIAKKASAAKRSQRAAKRRTVSHVSTASLLVRGAATLLNTCV